MLLIPHSYQGGLSLAPQATEHCIDKRQQHARHTTKKILSTKESICIKEKESLSKLQSPFSQNPIKKKYKEKTA